VILDLELGIEPGELAGISAELESARPREVIEWAIRRFGRALTIACSFQNCVIIDMAANIDPDVEVLFLDTGSHFAETLAYVEKVRCLYELNLKVQMPPPEADGVPCGAEGCCQLRKVRPLDAGLAGQRAWMSGLKRVDTAHRADAPVVVWDQRRRLVKINPLATWTDTDVERYIADRALPVHPLVERGYLSIGCAPATQPVLSGGDRRAGRWSGEAKTECGLHL
jgi:phosphoadenosine phosphosulfate reductase